MTNLHYTEVITAAELNHINIHDLTAEIVKQNKKLLYLEILYLSIFSAQNNYAN